MYIVPKSLKKCIFRRRSICTRDAPNVCDIPKCNVVRMTTGKYGFNVASIGLHKKNLNKKALTAEAVKNGLPIPQITFFWMCRNWKVIYYMKSEVLVLELNILFPGGGCNLLHSNLLCEIRSP